MSTLIHAEPASVNYYCPHCQIIFGALPDASGHVKCLACGRQRSDGFNQIGEFMYRCIACGCRLGVAPGEEPRCPNGPHRSGRATGA